MINSSHRRKLAHAGIRLMSFRGRNPDDPRFGGFMLVDAERNFVIKGGWPHEFSLDEEDVKAYVSELR